MWLILNLAFGIVVYVLSSLHDKRVVYIDRVLIHLVKNVLLHMVVFLMLVSFIDALPSWKVIVTLYGVFAAALALWWIISRKLLKWYRSKGYNYRRIAIIGGGSSGAGVRLIRQLMEDQGYGYHVVGFFDEEPIKDIHK